MGVFEELASKDHEQLVFCHDAVTGLKAIIAIHDTTLGPALGGTRMWAYANEADALRDVLRLSRGMTYKSAAAGLNLGGGKAVIKTGAEGVYVAALPAQGLGIALKIDDGASRASEVAIASVLAGLDVWTEDEHTALQGFRHHELLNWRRLGVGEVRGLNL